MIQLLTIHYEFVNVETGNVISHLSLPAALHKDQHVVKLDEEKILLATSHKLSLDKIYWQDKAKPV